MKSTGRDQPYRGATACAAILLALLAPVLLVSCENNPPTRRTVDSRPAQTAPAATTTAPATAPATQAAPHRPQPPKPDTPAPAEPEAPDFVAILARYEPDQRATARAKVEGPTRLSIDTHNVQHLRIDRQKAGLTDRRSVSLQLDGQGIEWLAGSAVDEFERSPAGVWTPVRKE